MLSRRGNDTGTLVGHQVEPEPSAQERPRRYAAGQRCAGDGCDTVLSIYNDGRFCAPCETRRQKAEKEEEAAVLAAASRPPAPPRQLEPRAKRGMTGAAAYQRALSMASMRARGATLAEIGAAWGLSAGRVSQILTEEAARFTQLDGASGFRSRSVA